MPKDARVLSLSFDRSRVSPYFYISKNAKGYKPPKFPLGLAKNMKEWEEARCPICLEHPHNAVLLQCSSYERGCRTFMCNTSYRHSNCLDQFRKSSLSSSSTEILGETPAISPVIHSRREEHSLPGQTGVNKLQENLVCPLCRGDINGWIVVEPARQYMNSKTRCCSSETCVFSGTYSELRKHARSKHPSTRPMVVDPVRKSDWTRLERERDFRDVLSALHLMTEEEAEAGMVGDYDNQSGMEYDSLEAYGRMLLEHERELEGIDNRAQSMYGEGNEGSVEMASDWQNSESVEMVSDLQNPNFSETVYLSQVESGREGGVQIVSDWQNPDFSETEYPTQVGSRDGNQAHNRETESLSRHASRSAETASGGRRRMRSREYRSLFRHAPRRAETASGDQRQTQNREYRSLSTNASRSAQTGSRDRGQAHNREYMSLSGHASGRAEMPSSRFNRERGRETRHAPIWRYNLWSDY